MLMSVWDHRYGQAVGAVSADRIRDLRDLRQVRAVDLFGCKNGARQVDERAAPRGRTKGYLRELRGATTRMTESLNLNQARLSPESPAVLYVCSRAPDHTILQTLGAQYARANHGIDLEEDITYEEFLDRADKLMGYDDFRSRDGCG